MKVIIIVAMDQQRGIGKNNDLMWHLPNDMRFFKEQTSGHVVIMGRKNWDSIPERFRPLPHRENAVITRNKHLHAEGAVVFNDLQNALNTYRRSGRETVYIIGGGQIYEAVLSLGMVDEMYITFVHETFDADTFFPSFDQDKWNVETLFVQEKDERHTCSFEVKHFTRKLIQA
jgi:dihydrofolate reductase